MHASRLATRIFATLLCAVTSRALLAQPPSVGSKFQLGRTAVGLCLPVLTTREQLGAVPLLAAMTDPQAHQLARIGYALDEQRGIFATCVASVRNNLCSGDAVAEIASPPDIAGGAVKGAAAGATAGLLWGLVTGKGGGVIGGATVGAGIGVGGEILDLAKAGARLSGCKQRQGEAAAILGRIPSNELATNMQQGRGVDLQQLQYGLAVAAQNRHITQDDYHALMSYALAFEY